MNFFRNQRDIIENPFFRFFQTSRRILLGACFLAFVLSLLLAPCWYQILNSPIPISVRMAAPGVEYVRFYWDNPLHQSNAYERIAIKPSQASKKWNIQIEALGEKNPQAKWTQVWLLDIRTPEQVMDWSATEMKVSTWEHRTDDWLPGGKALLANRGILQQLSTSIQGSNLTIRLVQSDYCGKVRITVNSEVREIDLYSSTLGVEEVKFYAVEPGDEIVREYSLNHIRVNPFQKLILLPEVQGHVQFNPSSPSIQELLEARLKKLIEIEQITVQGIRFRGEILQREAILFLPSRFWHRIFLLTVFATVISFVWIIALLVSFTNIWRGQGQKRFGIHVYIVGLAIALSGFWMFVFYPAHMTIDTIGQWRQALLNQYGTWFPPFTSIMMWITQLFTNQPDLFCFLQGSLFWFAIFYLTSQAIRNYKLFLISTIFFTLLPTLWIYSATLVTNVASASFTLLTAAFCIKAIRRVDQRWLWFSIIPASLALASRHDAVFTVLAPILVYQFVFWKHQQPRVRVARRLITIFLMLLLTVLPSRLIEKLPIVTNYTPVGFAFINQYVGTLYYAKQAGEISQVKLEIEQKVIDSEFGSGTFNALLKRYQCDAANYIQWVEPIIITPPRVYQSTSFILNQTIRVAFQHPIAYSKHKLCNLSYFLQIPNIFYFYAIPSNALSLRQELDDVGIRISSNLTFVRDGVLDLLIKLSREMPWSILFKHYLFLMISLILLLLGLVYQKTAIVIPSLIGLLSFCGFIIPDTFPDWRHLLLMHICTWISVLGAIDSCLNCKDKQKKMHRQYS